MKDVLRAIRERRSIRRFLPKPVPEDLVVSLVELACWAPSAGNLQPGTFLPSSIARSRMPWEKRRSTMIS